MRRVAEYRVIYGDTDRMGFLYYGNYLRLFEIARAEWIRALGRPYKTIEEEDGIGLPVVEARARYRRPARYDDRLSLHVRAAKVGGASVTFAYEVRDAESGALVAEGETTHALVNREGRPTRFPPALRDLLLEGSAGSDVG